MEEKVLDLVGGDHEHTLGMSGVHQGVRVRYETAPLMPVFERMIAERSYQACEFSLANYIMLKDRGADWLVAIPVFPQRAYRHANFYVCMDSPLRDASELAGKRIAVPDYSMTLAVWMRGILHEQYGVHWSTMHWLVGAKPRFAKLEGLEYDIATKDIEQALLDRDVDVLLAPRTRDERLPATSRILRRLVTDPQAAEEVYLRATGIYPINHVVVVRDDTLSRIPDVARVLFDLYERCKSAAYERRLGTTLVPWGARHWNQAFAKFSGDPMQYGLTDTNRNVVARLCDYLVDQKLISSVPALESLFPLSVK